MVTGSSAATVTTVAATTGAGRGKKVRPRTVTCSWCQQEVDVPAKGRVPKWCGTSCRHRAWEQHRAAKSGRSAVAVVERVVTVQLPAPAAPASPAAQSAQLPAGTGWVPLLTELARQLDTGRMYTRDLAAITPAFRDALQALNRRLEH